MPLPPGSGHGAAGQFPAALCLALWLLHAAGAGAAEQQVAPGSGTLQRAIEAAAPGDTLRLAAGRHLGPVTVDRPLAIVGLPGAVVDGGGSGRVVTLDAPGARLDGLEIVGSGACLACEDGAVYVTATAAGATVENSRLRGNLIGINIKGARDVLVRGNVIEGRDDLPMSERGNGVQLWDAPGSAVIGNRISKGRDGIFVMTSARNRFIDNRLESLRFAVHYMYTNDSEVRGNVSRGNHLGFALMFSHRLQVIGNTSQGDRDHGLMLNYANEAEIRGNAVSGGADKCVFIYNANHNRFVANRFEGCAIGIHFTAGSESNVISGNAFIGNRTQVKYVGTRHIEWSADGRGNYWSDNTAFDLDGDGIADRAYRPNDLVDQLVWRYPVAKLLLSSPAVQVLRWAQANFPPFYPGGVIDRAPLMAVPTAAGAATGHAG